MIDDAQLCGVKLLRPVTLFAGSLGWDKAVAFYGGFNRIVDAFENGVNQLPSAPFFTLHPTRCTRSNVAPHALNSRVRRVLMSGEFRFHDVTALSTELWRFHVLNSAICALCPDQNVEACGNGEKDYELPNVDSPVTG